MAIYLDNSATTFPKPEAVFQAVDHYLRHIGASSGRGAYRQALEADALIYHTRKMLGQLFNIKDVTRIIFTANVTESLNLALKGLLKSGDHVITSELEHNAVWRPLKVLEQEIGIHITVVSAPQGMSPESQQIEAAISTDTRLVVLNHASNVTGTLLPIKQAGQICRRFNVPLLVDAAQTGGAYPIDVQELNVDLLAFTGHKGLLGPTGTGGLYIAPGISLKPMKEGGTGGESLLEHQPEHLPDRYEAGTLNVAGIAGLGAAVDFILQEGVDKIQSHEQHLIGLALELLTPIPGLKVYGPQNAAERVAVISFNLDDVAPEEVAYVLDEVSGIMVRAGLHCAPQAHSSIGTAAQGTVRVSPGYFNTEEDIKVLAGALTDIASR